MSGGAPAGDRGSRAGRVGGDVGRDGGRDWGREVGRDLGRDGVSGLVSRDRAMRARDVSRPAQAEVDAADKTVERLLARISGRR